MKIKRSDVFLSSVTYRNAALAALVWTVVLTGSLAWYLIGADRQILEIARHEAAAYIGKDIAFRAWATSHGGVYVPPTESTPPNPYLAGIPDRDVETTGGKKLTLMNPAYMLREVQSRFVGPFGEKGRITSLRPLNPDNAPDPWERSALQRFEAGDREVAAVVNVEGISHLRVMRPFLIEQGCLKCHGRQGYKVGDVRGGIAVSLSLEPLYAASSGTKHNIVGGHAAAWGLGLMAIALLARQNRRREVERDAAEGELRRSESSLAEAQRIAHLGNWELDLASNALSWSAEIYRIFEIDPQAFGASYEAFLAAIHPDDRALVDRAYTDSVAQRKPYDLVHRLRMKDGRVKYVNERCETYYGPDGTPVRSVGTVHDVTAQKVAEDSVGRLQRYLELIVQSLGEGVLTLDAEGRHVLVNPAAARMLGHPLEELIGQRSHPIWHHTRADGSEYPEADCPIFHTLRDGETRRRDDEIFWRRDGSHFPVEYVAAPLRDEGRISGAVVTFLDISERKRAGEAVLAMNRELEQRVAGRTAQLELANKELEAFAFSVSHDLRAPLRAIDGFSRILVEDYEATLDAEARRLLGVVRDNAARMAQLIEDILSFSRMGRRDMEAGDVDVGDLARSAFAELQAAAPGRALRLTVGSVPTARGDRAMLRQVLVNLIANAIKFTAPRAEAVIEIGGSAGPDEDHYYIRDNGVGFDMQYVDKLFGVFQRLHSAEEFEGTGIGLAIVKRIVERHGGRVWAEGKVDEGALVHFTLPHRAAPPEGTPA